MLFNSLGEYDSIIIGNSVVDCFTPSSVQQYMGWGKTLKLTVNGGAISEQSFMLKQALKTCYVKHVFWGLRAKHLMSEKEDVWHPQKKIPFYLYTNTVFDDWPYLFNNMMFRSSI